MFLLRLIFMIPGVLFFLCVALFISVACGRSLSRIAQLSLLAFLIFYIFISNL
jgi:c-di-AMP phosphodiesterase-like protein